MSFISSPAMALSSLGQAGVQASASSRSREADDNRSGRLSNRFKQSIDERRFDDGDGYADGHDNDVNVDEDGDGGQQAAFYFHEEEEHHDEDDDHRHEGTYRLQGNLKFMSSQGSELSHLDIVA